jgi:hypothetical protein
MTRKTALLGLAVLATGCGGVASPPLGAAGAAAPSGPKIAAELKWGRCIRSHGVPSFPDPNRQGALDSSKFDDSTPVFQSASKACQSLTKAAGAISVVPGRG